MARTHYENFTVVSWLLPRRLHQHFYNVYAYCRWADDLADEVGDPVRSLELLDWWQEELLSCYSGRSRHPVMMALSKTIQAFAIPPEPFLNLLVAFRQDQVVREYESYEQLMGYCQNSANPVGRLVLYLCGCHDERRGRLADAICTGLQLANFWQDVGRDLDRGRVYLPREDRQQFGYLDEQLQARVYNEAFCRMMAMQVRRAREWFDRGRPLVEQMPPWAQVDIDLFIRGGLAILDKIEAVHYDVWSRRPQLTRRDQWRLLGRCAIGRLRRTPHRNGKGTGPADL